MVPAALPCSLSPGHNPAGEVGLGRSRDTPQGLLPAGARCSPHSLALRATGPAPCSVITALSAPSTGPGWSSASAGVRPLPSLGRHGHRSGPRCLRHLCEALLPHAVTLHRPGGVGLRGHQPGCGPGSCCAPPHGAQPSQCLQVLALARGGSVFSCSQEETRPCGPTRWPGCLPGLHRPPSGFDP